MSTEGERFDYAAERRRFNRNANYLGCDLKQFLDGVNESWGPHSTFELDQYLEILSVVDARLKTLRSQLEGMKERYK